ncbi:hypothetical protein LCGC14_2441010, partial [marine sediment metagenome]
MPEAQDQSNHISDRSDRETTELSQPGTPGNSPASESPPFDGKFYGEPKGVTRESEEGEHDFIAASK